MLGARICLILYFMLALQACATPEHLIAHNDMAAKIYMDLAHYYWQQGHMELATDRAHLALQQTPDYPPAIEFLDKIQTDID